MIPQISKYAQEIRAAAKEAGLKPSLVAAIVMQESAGSQYAMRFEPAWTYFRDIETYAKKCKVSIDTERQAQAFSYGLMQIMGSVARERDFGEPLPLLFAVEKNLEIGCKHLKGFLDKYKDEAKAIVSYNAGSPRLDANGKYVNQHYLDGVNSFRKNLLDLDGPVA